MTGLEQSEVRHSHSNVDSALLEVIDHYITTNPKSCTRHNRAREWMPGGNTRTILHYPPFPLGIARGEDAYLWDLDGHKYTDFLGEYSAALFGHSHPQILGAIESTLSSGLTLGGPNEFEVELAAVLCARFPSVELIRFCNSGTEANLMAISAVLAATGRSTVLVFEGAYHGGVFYYARGGSPLNARFSTLIVPYNNPQAVSDAFKRHGNDIAGVIVEPMMGAAGCIAGEPEFLSEIRKRTKEYGSFLIFDEVMTSRLGPGGMQQVLGIIPDMTTFGKYIGGGLASGAFGGSREIMERFDPSRIDAFPHSGTFNNNVLTMHAGLVGLTQVFTPEASCALTEAGNVLRSRLNALSEIYDLPLQVTGVGSLLGFHFNPHTIRTARDTYNESQSLKTLFHLDMVTRGQYLAHRGYVALSLPMTEGDFDGLVSAVKEFLESRGDIIRAQCAAEDRAQTG